MSFDVILDIVLVGILVVVRKPEAECRSLSVTVKRRTIPYGLFSIEKFLLRAGVLDDTAGWNSFVIYNHLQGNVEVSAQTFWFEPGNS